MSNTTEIHTIETPIIDPKEFAVAEAEAAVSANTFTYTFTKPFTYEGKTYEALTFDWDRLTGKDALAIEGELQALGKAVIVPEFSGEYLIRMAARACTERIGSDLLCAVPISAYNRIRGAARSFLLRSGS